MKFAPIVLRLSIVTLLSVLHACSEPAAASPGHPALSDDASRTNVGDVGFRLTMEENGGEVIQKLGEHTIVGSRFDLGLRAVVWRESTKSGSCASKVRLAFGWWPAGGFAALAGGGFREQVWFQLTPEECGELIEMLQSLTKAEFEDAGVHVVYRDIDAVHGDLKMRKFPNGTVQLFFWSESDEDIWLTIEPERFERFLLDTVETARKLDATPPSVDWR